MGTPVVVVPKPDGGIRICGDFKTTLNKYLETEHYPLPSVMNIFANIGEGHKVFTVLNLSQAYLQLAVDEDSSQKLLINTHIGFFSYTRLPYGISSAPSIFQSVMDRILRNLKKVACYLDDVLIAGKDLAECKRNVKEVLKRMSEYGVTVNEKKCQIFLNKVPYLGHLIDVKRLHPVKDKCEAIQKAPIPKDKTQLKAYLGLLHYYGKFLPNLSSRLKPLYKVLHDHVKWIWTEKETKVFEDSKRWLQVLIHYDPNKVLTLTCDASPYGVGAVLAHVVNGEDRPIMFASRTLSKAEQNLST